MDVCIKYEELIVKIKDKHISEEAKCRFIVEKLVHIQGYPQILQPYRLVFWRHTTADARVLYVHTITVMLLIGFLHAC